MHAVWFSECSPEASVEVSGRRSSGRIQSINGSVPGRDKRRDLQGRPFPEELYGREYALNIQGRKRIGAIGRIVGQQSPTYKMQSLGRRGACVGGVDALDKLFGHFEGRWYARLFRCTSPKQDGRAESSSILQW
jgi:hypothetical protein